MVKRVKKVEGELRDAIESGDTDEIEGILKTLRMPSQKEWEKLIRKLVFTAVESGILRAHFEMSKLFDRYKFKEDTWNVSGSYSYEVVLPQEALDYLNKYSLEISVLTDETILNRIRKQLERGVRDGIGNKELYDAIKDAVDGEIAEWHAETIARTENGKLYNAGRVARYLDPDNEDFVEALQYDAVVDTRTTDLCKRLDGKIISIHRADKIAQMTPPNHFSCRATWLPVTKYEDWEDDWDDSEEAEKGFQFTSPLPKLLKGKTEPLVKTKKPKVANKITDIDEIRALESDDDFKEALQNVENPAKRTQLISERGLQMVKKNATIRNRNATKFDGELFSTKRRNEDVLYFEFNFQKFYVPNTPKNQQAMFKIITFLKSYSAGDRTEFEVMEAILGTAEKYAEAEDFETALALEVLADNLDKVLKRNYKTVSLKRANSALSDDDMEKLRTKPVNEAMEKHPRLETLRNRADSAVQWFQEQVNPEILKKKVVLAYSTEVNHRAYASGDHIVLALDEATRTIVHEYGHVLHDHNEELIKAVKDFFEFRTRGDELTTMYFSENSKGEKVEEVALPDNFYNDYVGRVYPWEKDDPKGTEIISMGLELMYADPTYFYNNDPEYFGFIYAIMRGVY
jgi:SPP1 gp7 family putative phage head morphogenesis protein